MRNVCPFDSDPHTTTQGHEAEPTELILENLWLLPIRVADYLNQDVEAKYFTYVAAITTTCVLETLRKCLVHLELNCNCIINVYIETLSILFEFCHCRRLFLVVFSTPYNAVVRWMVSTIENWIAFKALTFLR